MRIDAVVRTGSKLRFITILSFVFKGTPPILMQVAANLNVKGEGVVNAVNGV